MHTSTPLRALLALARATLRAAMRLLPRDQKRLMQQLLGTLATSTEFMCGNTTATASTTSRSRHLPPWRR